METVKSETKFKTNKIETQKPMLLITILQWWFALIYFCVKQLTGELIYHFSITFSILDSWSCCYIAYRLLRNMWLWLPSVWMLPCLPQWMHSFFFYEANKCCPAGLEHKPSLYLFRGSPQKHLPSLRRCFRFFSLYCEIKPRRFQPKTDEKHAVQSSLLSAAANIQA